MANIVTSLPAKGKCDSHDPLTIQCDSLGCLIQWMLQVARSSGFSRLPDPVDSPGCPIQWIIRVTWPVDYLGYSIQWIIWITQSSGFSGLPDPVDYPVYPIQWILRVTQSSGFSRLPHPVDSLGYRSSGFSAMNLAVARSNSCTCHKLPTTSSETRYKSLAHRLMCGRSADCTQLSK